MPRERAGWSAAENALDAIFCLRWWSVAGAVVCGRRLFAEIACCGRDRDRNREPRKSHFKDTLRPEMAGPHRIRHQHPDDRPCIGCEDGCKCSGPGNDRRRHGRCARQGLFCAVRTARNHKAGIKSATQTQDCPEPSGPAHAARSTAAAIWIFRQRQLVSQSPVRCWRARRDSNSRPSDSKSDALSS
jgi:hypothetical protein